LIHDGKAMMICSQNDIDSIYPNSHHYLPHSLSNNNIIPDTCNDFQKIVLKAIQECKSKKICANIDNIHAIMLHTNSNNDFSISKISGEIAILELNGIVKNQNGVFSLNRKNLK
ncbi:DNA processing protein DprA, partial [Gardnerella vaginalis]